MSDDYYALLKVPRDASAQEVEDALRQQLNIWSRRANNAPRAADRREAEENVELLQKAKAALTDPAHRDEHDRALLTDERYRAPVGGGHLSSKAEEEIDVQRVARWNDEFFTWVHRFDAAWRASELSRSASDRVCASPGTSRQRLGRVRREDDLYGSLAGTEAGDLVLLFDQGAHLDEVISRWPRVHVKHRAVVLRLGDACMARGQPARAESYYRKGADIDPRFEQGTTPRAACLLRLALMAPQCDPTRRRLLAEGIQTLRLWAASSVPELALGDAGKDTPEPGSPTERLRRHDEVAASCTRLGLDDAEQAMVLSLQRGVLLCRLGDHDDARRCYAEARDLASATGDEVHRFLAEARLAEVALAIRDYATGREILGSVLAAASRNYKAPAESWIGYIHQHWFLDFVMCLFAVAEWHLGRYETAMWALGAIKPYLPKGLALDYEDEVVVAALLGVEPSVRRSVGRVNVDPTSVAAQVGADRDRLESAWTEGQNTDWDLTPIYARLLDD
jgi:tetratricopeptide (TPR) repeat protein